MAILTRPGRKQNRISRKNRVLISNFVFCFYFRTHNWQLVQCSVNKMSTKYFIFAITVIILFIHESNGKLKEGECEGKKDIYININLFRLIKLKVG